MLHLETIAPETLSLLTRIQSLPAFAQTRLVGGTSLALQLGHRISVESVRKLATGCRSFCGAENRWQDTQIERKREWEASVLLC